MNSKTLENIVLWPTHINSSIKIDSQNQGLEKKRITQNLYWFNL